jgi:hypothetical protein
MLWSVQATAEYKTGREGWRLTQDDGVGGEDGEVGMQLVEKVQLVAGAADGPRKEEDIALEPRDLGRRVLEANTRARLRHDQLTVRGM